MRTKITTLLFSALFAQSVSAQFETLQVNTAGTEARGLAVIGDTLFTAIYDKGVYYSVNNGDTWTAWQFNSGLSNYKINNFYGAEQSLVILGDGLFAYYEQGKGLINVPVIGAPDNTFSSWYKEENPSMNFFGTKTGVYSATDAFVWSASNGISATDSINDLNVFEDENGFEYLVAATDNGLYKSTDNGQNFSAFGAGLPAGRVNDLGFLILHENGVYVFDNDDQLVKTVISEGDFYGSYLNFGTFEAYVVGDNVIKKINLMNNTNSDVLTTGISGGIMTATTVLNDYLFVCTENGGVFRKSLSGNVSVQENNSSSFSVFPNPSKGNFLITVSTPTVVDLLDSKGVLIASYLVQSTLNVSENLASGLYFVQEKGSNKTQKLIIQ